MSEAEDFPANKFPFKVSNINTRKASEIYSKLTIKALEQRRWLCYDAFNANFEQISHLFLVPLSTLNRKRFAEFLLDVHNSACSLLGDSKLCSLIVNLV